MMSRRISGGSVFELFPCSTMLFRCKQTLHPIFLKLVGFASQRTLGDIDFFGSLPCSFVEEYQRADLLIEFLLRPQRPLLNLCPFVGALTAMAFRCRHLLL